MGNIAASFPSESRRKRSRSQFDAENIDSAAVSTAPTEQHPRKKQKLKTASSLPIDAVSSLPRSPRKRAFSETALSSNDEHSRILRECSPNKKIKIVADSQNSAMNGMMVDEEEEAEAVENGKRSISIEHKADLDDEGDVSMESATKIETANAN